MDVTFHRSNSAPDRENRNVEFAEESVIYDTDSPHENLIDHIEDGRGNRARRRSSISQRWNSLRQIGGPNSIDNFARSFQRSANFREIRSVRRNSVFVEPVAVDDEDDNENEEIQPQKIALSNSASSGSQSLLTRGLSFVKHQQNLDADSQSSRPTEASGLLQTPQFKSRRSSAPVAQPELLDGNLKFNYGSISNLLTSDAQSRATALADERFREALWAQENLTDYDAEIQQRKLEIHSNEAGEKITRVVGDSTVPMTMFNMVNALVGIGMLALPLGLTYTGWVLGISFFTAAALTTFYTAGLLTKCLDTNTASMTYGDISYLAFGAWGRRWVESIFFLELLVGGTGLIVLFGDSMNQIFPSIGVHTWQIAIAVGLLPLNFAPFKYLSLTSILGIFCTMGLIVMVFTDGVIKPSQPGSLRQIASTDVFPSNIRAIPLSIGLFMSPWGGHAIIPAVYRDMRHPQKFPLAAKTSYGASYVLDLSMAIIGYLMFGNDVMHEVTAGILKSSFYPAVISFILILLIALINTTKLPLITRPIIDTVTSYFLPDVDDIDAVEESLPEKKWTKPETARYTTAILINFVELGLAIAFPKFESIVGLLGSAFCISICIILPVSFYLKIFSVEGKGISLLERTFCWFLIIVSTFLAIIGTIYSIVPREMLGLEPERPMLLFSLRG